MDYYVKYLKYKNKYIQLKKQLGGIESTENKPKILTKCTFDKNKKTGTIKVNGKDGNIENDDIGYAFIKYGDKEINKLHMNAKYYNGKHKNCTENNGNQTCTDTNIRLVEPDKICKTVFQDNFGFNYEQ